MNRNNFFAALLAIAAVLGREKASAQSVSGSWIKTSEIITHMDGKAVDMFERIKKQIPCFAGIVYIFSTGGKMDEDASGCPATIQKTAVSINRQTSWKQTGDKITLNIAGDAAPIKRSVYHIRFAGNDEMVWTFVYAENPGTPNPLKTKEMVTTYHRRT